MNKRKRSVSRWLLGGSICTASLFIVVICLLITYNHHEVHYREKKTTHLVRERVVLNMWQIERGFAQRQIHYMAELFRVQSQEKGMLDQYHQEIINWGNAHRYYDGYNGQTYMPNYEYSQNEDASLDGTDALKNAHTIKDYQAIIRLIAANNIHLQAMKVDAVDKAMWYQPHATDLRLIKYHHLSGQVVVVSFIEQVARVYQDGKLVRAFLVTSGRFGDPSPIGMWHISRRRWHTVFKSRVPIGSPNWYPDTPINYAMEYRTGGYYLHDSWWRRYYGPGTNFPHYDPAGREFAGTGSHGCINLSEGAAAWLYENTGYDTAVITY